MYTVKFKKSASKELRKLPNQYLNTVISAIDQLEEKPRPEGCKKLKGLSEDIWRIRISNYRVLYAIHDEIKIISIRKISHRKDVYR